MFKQIVVAYDGSEPSQAGAELAFRIAHSCGANVVLAHAVEGPSSIPAHAEVLASLEQRLAEEDRNWLGALRALEELAPQGTRLEPKLLRGQAAGALLEEMKAVGADLAVAGTHGVGGLKPLLGSISHQLLGNAPCPVLLVRGGALPAGRLSVLAALDGSEASVRALMPAQALAVALEASLRLVHVVDPTVPFATNPPARFIEELRRHGRKVLRDAHAIVTAPLDEVIEEMREGSPRSELMAACEEHSPAIAVVATRGVGGFPGLRLGSTARGLVNHAPCPVLVTRD